MSSGPGRGQMGGRGFRGGQRQADPTNPEQLQAFAERALEAGQMELLLGEEDPGRRMGFAESDVVEVRMGFHDGRLVYELKVALDQYGAYGPGIGARDDKPVGLGLLTPEMEMGAVGGRGGGVRPRGGMGGGGRGGGEGGMRGGMRPGGQSMPDPLAVWLRLDLAAGPAAEPIRDD